jgi:hypothetical protein
MTETERDDAVRKAGYHAFITMAVREQRPITDESIWSAAWAAGVAHGRAEDWQQRYFNLYNATRDLCALVDATIPHMMMTPDQQNNAYLIMDRMKAALAPGAAEAVRAESEDPDAHVD